MQETIRADIRARILQGKGEEPADLVLKNVTTLDVMTGEVFAGDIAICGDTIVGIAEEYSGKTELDCTGQIAVPGFIDTHLHVESSLVTPLEFDRCVLPHGVTTAICDPHEIANVLGAEGIQYFLDCTEHTIMDLRVQLSSCVPATGFETSGAELHATDLAPFMHHSKVIGLAEVMNFPGVLAGDKDMVDKLALFADRPRDGHAPLLAGKDLNAYSATGIATEHEATTAAEAREKLRKGLTILIREGSVSKDLHALAEIIDENTSSFMAFCTDDRNPMEIAEEGHIDYMIRTAIALGRPLHHVYRMASWSAAKAFRLWDRGMIAPGYRADIALVSSLQKCQVEQVLSAGRLVDDALFATRSCVSPIGRSSVKAKKVTPQHFNIESTATGDNQTVAVIGVKAGLILTQHNSRVVKLANGALLADPQNDLAKVAVVERHGKTTPAIPLKGLGFVEGFELARGALASSVGHDSHNITVIGVNDDDMAIAVNRLIDMEGGFVVVSAGKVLAEFALPIAGLISELPYEQVHEGLIPLRKAAKTLGCCLPEPFLQVAFLPLPVIPHLKITDLGLFDVDRFCHITL
ncbi:MAG: adenine deaminase [Hyphomicrobiales bacterium]|nr:adenine deaminase [Hyphomicrobiales bacterium]PCJ95714.1 MAG: adenine deaminase [Hyphomicrobiales bacterium]